MAAPSAPSRHRGTVVVLALLALGAALAVVARRHRVPGSAPSLRLVPSEEDLRARGRDWVPPPGKEVPGRPVARVRFLDAASGAEVDAVEMSGPRLAGPPRRADDGAWVVEFLPGTRERPAPLAEEVTVGRPGGAGRALALATRPSTREDGLDAPVFRVALP